VRVAKRANNYRWTYLQRVESRAFVIVFASFRLRFAFCKMVS